MKVQSFQKVLSPRNILSLFSLSTTSSTKYQVCNIYIHNHIICLVLVSFLQILRHAGWLLLGGAILSWPMDREKTQGESKTTDPWISQTNPTNHGICQVKWQMETNHKKATSMSHVSILQTCGDVITCHRFLSYSMTYKDYLAPSASIFQVAGPSCLGPLFPRRFHVMPGFSWPKQGLREPPQGWIASSS